ncbi:MULTISPECIES: hypothetical protein [unclassified Streptomyces]|nr:MULTISPECIES: hypothetical protein [unclassified Streptomyces]WUC68951.1 hypothetical protein OG861_32315 [Streptomyces sp. NBC_00539]
MMERVYLNNRSGERRILVKFDEAVLVKVSAMWSPAVPDDIATPRCRCPL